MCKENDTCQGKKGKGPKEKKGSGESERKDEGEGEGEGGPWEIRGDGEEETSSPTWLAMPGNREGIGARCWQGLDLRWLPTGVGRAGGHGSQLVGYGGGRVGLWVGEG
ncbi:unnamed protein product [Prunus armeniaca]|uniref:Uncharacterized protein n=1 Tax=Prunus armeniaca TaxID=36596 RepID=A0A6J5TJK9_PRUAR|nr:unnamed protein product [Prunus armeniaca]